MSASAQELEAAARACATEPIRVPGSIQPHGVLLAVDPADLRVVVASAGAGEALGRALGDLLPGAVDVVRAVADGDDDLVGTPTPVPASGPIGGPVGGLGAGTGGWSLLASRSEGLVLVELEPARGDEEGAGTGQWQTLLPTALRRLQDARSVERLVEGLAAGVRRLTGFDRVMVYRFDEDWNGEVVAEERREDLEPFLGLHYPASDIPAQARALYAQQWLRIIPDARYTPVPLVPPAHPGTGAPLDLSPAVLRSVSPVHLQYLANMGVASSMSVSLVSDGRLWGLVACHHYAGPHRPSPSVRLAAEFLGRTASLLLPTVTGREAAAAVLESSRVRAVLTELVAERPELPLEALTRESTTLADLVPCSGAALRLGGELRLLGSTPDAEDVAALAEHVGPGPLVTSCLARDVPALARLSERASGVLAAPLAGGQTGDCVLWFRPEVLREVTWGGDPHEHEVVQGEEGRLRLSPRHSFEAWSETVAQTAVRWAPHEVDTATAFAQHLSESMLRQVERTSRLATALQQTMLLEKLPDLPGLDVGFRYAPHSNDVVGGDWYDIVPLPSGRTGVVLGDVAGHGLAVSAVSAQMRNALRAHLLSTQDPARALDRLNDLVTALMPGELATAVVAVVDAATGQVDVANAGHPPLVHVDAAGAASLVDEGAHGPALGLVDGAAYQLSRLQLEPGGVVLLYSDGLVEDRSTDWEERVEQLLAVAEGPTGDLDALCGRLVDTVSRHADDTTVLAVRSTRTPAPAATPSP